MKKSDSYIILEQLIQKRLLVIKPAELITWLNNLESTGQITEQESKDLLTLAEQLNIYNVPFTEYSFLLLRTDLYLHPSLLPMLDGDQEFRVTWHLGYSSLVRWLFPTFPNIR